MKTKKKCDSVIEWGPQLFYDCPNDAAPGMHYCVNCLDDDPLLETPLTNAARQALRQYRLDIRAHLAGFENWGKLETAALRDEIMIAKTIEEWNRHFTVGLDIGIPASEITAKGLFLSDSDCGDLLVAMKFHLNKDQQRELGKFLSMLKDVSGT